MVSREYLQTLRNYQYYFSKNFRIYLSRHFDPRPWLKSKDVIAELVWPKDVLSEYEAFERGDCRSIDFVLVVYTPENKKREIIPHTLIIKYKPYISNLSIVVYPSKFSHSCSFCDFQLVSLGDVYIYCKHLYASLREIEAIAEKNNIEEIKATKSMFYPRNPNLIRRFEEIEKSKKPATEKLGETFKLLEEELYVEELKSLERLSRRLDHLNKI
jgi:hypothetical protein